MADTYLSRTPSSAGNRKTWTISAWVKRGTIFDSSSTSADADQVILGSAVGAVNYAHLMFSHDQLRFYDINSGTYVFRFKSTAEFRDPAAWYHVVASCDTTQATESNRFKIYVNGSQVTSWANSVYPSQNADTLINSTNLHTVGRYSDASSGFFNGYMSEYHLIDGTAYPASTFGQTDTSGVWVPKVGPAVTYGTNGFYLKFANSGAMGTDSSGQSNTLALGGGTLRQVPDSPTNVFAMMNPLNMSGSMLLKQGNLRAEANGADQAAAATLGITSGKWYFEFYYPAGDNPELGLMPANKSPADQSSSASTSLDATAFITNNGQMRTGAWSSTSTTGLSSQTGESLIGVAVDADNGKMWFTNGSGTYFNSGNPATGANAQATFDADWLSQTGGVIPYTIVATGAGNYTTVNFGQDGTFAGAKTAQNNADGNSVGNFYYAPPTGFLALCTDNLSSTLTIPINKGADNFNTVTFTSGSSSTDVTVGFQPNFVWHKLRSSSENNYLIDQVRGGNKVLISNSSGAESTTTAITSFNTNGYTVDANLLSPNSSYVSWNWKAGGTAPANTYAVKVVSDSGNKYRFDDFGTSAITLELQEGGTFTFDQSDSSNAGHPLRFSSTADGTHGGGSEYTTGVTTTGTPGQAGAKTVITVAGSAPTLYYYCSVHSGMGGQANTDSLFGFTNVKGATQTVVSPNDTAGFSIIKFTGTGGDTTIGHGLSSAPKMIILKNRADVLEWAVYHRSLGVAKRLLLDTADSVSTSSSFWNSTSPSSTVISLGSSGNSNGSSDSIIAYAFAEIEGYSKFSSYTGNGSTDGTFVYTGFRPAFVLVRSTGSGNWLMQDNKRLGYNSSNSELFANLTNAETTSDRADLLSNGFKARQNSSENNSSGQEYIYMAFAENPFVTSTGKPVTAR